MGPVKSFNELPTFDELPDKRRYWEWGPAGSYEEALGKLNLLTDEHVAKAAAGEIKTGKRVGLGWEFRKLEYPPNNRIPFNLKIKWVDYPMAFDDEYHMNPQQSSQWDGLRHHSQPINPKWGASLVKMEEKDNNPDDHVVWFGGTKPSEITADSDRLSIHHWSKKGIVGRGVLIDYAKYARNKGIKYSSFSTHQITLDQIKEIIELDNIEIKPGDILFVHIGLVEEWDEMKTQQRIDYQKNPQHCGVEQTEDVLRWLWNNHFTAVAGDAISWEVYPSQNPNLALHHYLLAGWGVPIGELFDLSELSKVCQELNRYSFFVSSAPFNAIGGVSSPPNALAIF